MKRSDLKTCLSPHFAYMLGFIAFSFFLAPYFLYAEVKIKSLSENSQVTKLVLKEESDKVQVEQLAGAQAGDVLPDSCRICVKRGEAIIEQNGKEITLRKGEYFDGMDSKVKEDLKDFEKIAEGEMNFQDNIKLNQQSKPLGNPILVGEGFVLLRLNACHVFDLISYEEYQELLAEPPPAPPDYDEGPHMKGITTTPCASPPC